MDMICEKKAKYEALLQEASKAYLAKQYTKACKVYNDALDIARQIKPNKIIICIIKYMVASCLVESDELNDLAEAVYILEYIDNESKKRFPSIYFVLAKAHCKLYRFNQAKLCITLAENILQTNVMLESFYIPGTTVIIKQNMNDESWMLVKNEIYSYHQPDAICYLENCCYIHKPYVTSSRHIYLKSPDFNGMAIVHCNYKQSPCIMKFHSHCWKVQKDLMYPKKKVTDKDILGNRCFNLSCTNSKRPSLITMIEIVGKDGQIKSKVVHSAISMPDEKTSKDIVKPTQSNYEYSDDQILIVNNENNSEFYFSDDSEYTAQQKYFIFSMFYDYIKEHVVCIRDVKAKYEELYINTDLERMDIVQFLLKTHKIKLWNKCPSAFSSLSQNNEVCDANSNSIKKSYDDRFMNECDFSGNKNLGHPNYENIYDHMVMSDEDDVDIKTFSNDKKPNNRENNKGHNANNVCEEKVNTAAFQNKNFWKPISPAPLSQDNLSYCNGSSKISNENKILNEHITDLKSQLDKMLEESDNLRTQLKDKNFQIELLKKQLEENKQQWQSLDETLAKFKQNYDVIKEENIKLKTETIDLMQDKEALESKLLQSDDPESRRIKLLQDFQEEYKILEEQLRSECQKSSDEKIKKALEKEVETRFLLLVKCLNNQYSSNRHLINGYIEICKIVLDIITKINNWILNTFKINQFIDPTEWAVKMSCYTKSLSDCQNEYKMYCEKVHSDLPENNDLHDITLTYPALPSLPQGYVSDIVLRALNVCAERYYASQFAQKSYPHHITSYRQPIPVYPQLPSFAQPPGLVNQAQGFTGAVVPNFQQIAHVSHPINPPYKQAQDQQLQMQVTALQQQLQQLNQKLSFNEDSQVTVSYPETTPEDSVSSSISNTPKKSDKNDFENEYDKTNNFIMNDNANVLSKNEEIDDLENDQLDDNKSDKADNCLNDTGLNHCKNDEVAEDTEVDCREYVKFHYLKNSEVNDDTNCNSLDHWKNDEINNEHEKNASDTKLQSPVKNIEANVSFFEENQREKFSQSLEYVQKEIKALTVKSDLEIEKFDESFRGKHSKDDLVDTLLTKSSAPIKKTVTLDSLVDRFKAKYPGTLEADLVYIIFEIRKRHNNSLTGLTVRQMLHESEEIFSNNQHIHLVRYAGNDEADICTPSTLSSGSNYLKLRSNSVSSNNSCNSPMSAKRNNAANSVKMSQNNPVKPVQKKAWNTLVYEEIKWTGTGESECSICMSEVNKNSCYTLDCNHVFHIQCVKPWLKANRSCPNCRIPVTQNDEFPPLPVN